MTQYITSHKCEWTEFYIPICEGNAPSHRDREECVFMHFPLWSLVFWNNLQAHSSHTVSLVYKGTFGHLESG